MVSVTDELWAFDGKYFSEDELVNTTVRGLFYSQTGRIQVRSTRHRTKASAASTEPGPWCGRRRMHRAEPGPAYVAYRNPMAVKIPGCSP